MFLTTRRGFLIACAATARFLETVACFFDKALEMTHSVACGAQGGPSEGTDVQLLLPTPIR